MTDAKLHAVKIKVALLTTRLRNDLSVLADEEDTPKLQQELNLKLKIKINKQICVCVYKSLKQQVIKIEEKRIKCT